MAALTKWQLDTSYDGELLVCILLIYVWLKCTASDLLPFSMQNELF